VELRERMMDILSFKAISGDSLIIRNNECTNGCQRRRDIDHGPDTADAPLNRTGGITICLSRGTLMTLTTLL
jgi:hypothetical protein